MRRCVFFSTFLFCLGAPHAQTKTVYYYYTDPQGTVLAEADASGNVIARYDYTPYGSQVLGLPTAGPGYTGHVNDPDTGMVYMQHRYYDPDMGRFLSVDVVSLKPGDLNYMNRYEYVGNNPVMRTDPSGDYICSGSDSQCGTIRKALGDVQKAAGGYPQGSKGEKLLNGIVKFYGKEGEKNGVNVGFDNAQKNNAVTETNGKETNITFNLRNIADTGMNEGTNIRVEMAAAVAHEGQHGIDGQFFGRPSNHETWRATEYRAFTAQSYINEAFDKTSPYGLWESGWKDVPVFDGLRDSAANYDADWTVYRNGDDQ